MKYQDIDISIEEAEQILLDCYKIRGSAQKLDGEIDFNFKIISENNECFVLKISRPESDGEYYDFQEAIIQHLSQNPQHIESPNLYPSKNGNYTETFPDDKGRVRYVRLLSYSEGRIWSAVNPKNENLRFSLGLESGKITKSLKSFNYPFASRQFEWDIAQYKWTRSHLDLFENPYREIIEFFLNGLDAKISSYQNLRKSVIHNDINDNNIIVSNDYEDPKVINIIDFGDAVYSQTINDLAVCCAYGMMDFNDPLDACLPIIKGFNTSYKLEEAELEHLFFAIGIRLVISVTKSAVNRTKEPQNSYLQISDKQAWDLLKKWRNVSADLAHYSFRNECGFTPHPNEEKFLNWAQKQIIHFTDIIPSAPSNSIHQLDLSVGSNWTGHLEELEDLELFDFKLNKLKKQYPDRIIAGGYCEPRAIYSSSAYDKLGNSGIESRTIHVGIDFWFPASTPVHALDEGEVVTAVDDQGEKEYGGLLILRHTVDDFEFYSLYAHNNPESVLRHSIGDKIEKGEQIAELGSYPENGNWAPHLHFQIMLSMLDYKIDFPGVVYPKQLDVWKSIIPNPNLLFKSEELDKENHLTNDLILAKRKDLLGKSLSLQYKKPLHIVRGFNQYLIDANGRKYLDTVNNVAHVGHENISVVKAGQAQMAVLNTNTRYLNEEIIELSQRLLATFPKELCVVHFVNSGSEANELAMRMVKTATGSEEMIASEMGYHGNTSATVNISSYKFEGKGSSGKPESTHIFPLPDVFRGKYRGADGGVKYAKEIKDIINDIESSGKKVGGLIVEPIISCGGQVELPKGFLQEAYNHVRLAGGICISDEVQTGCGRVGKAFWGFQLHNVIPDIVTIGKPLGNGHPVAAVVCTKNVADKFANGMEYFNTFGGNPVSCAIANKVLTVVINEKLQENALQVGDYLKKELIALKKDYPIIGNVRGEGLFLGIELTDKDFNPLPLQTEYLINRMKEKAILMSSDGKFHNVIKIKPPLTFTIRNAEELLVSLKQILLEDFMNLNYVK